MKTSPAERSESSSHGREEVVCGFDGTIDRLAESLASALGIPIYSHQSPIFDPWYSSRDLASALANPRATVADMAGTWLAEAEAEMRHLAGRRDRGGSAPSPPR